jgi:hypothetical protein
MDKIHEMLRRKGFSDEEAKDFVNDFLAVSHPHRPLVIAPAPLELPPPPPDLREIALNRQINLFGTAGQPAPLVEQLPFRPEDIRDIDFKTMMKKIYMASSSFFVYPFYFLFTNSSAAFFGVRKREIYDDELSVVSCQC